MGLVSVGKLSRIAGMDVIASSKKNQFATIAYAKTSHATIGRKRKNLIVKRLTKVAACCNLDDLTLR
jgi:hypothetical protein